MYQLERSVVQIPAFQRSNEEVAQVPLDGIGPSSGSVGVSTTSFGQETDSGDDTVGQHFVQYKVDIHSVTTVQACPMTYRKLPTSRHMSVGVCNSASTKLFFLSSRRRARCASTRIWRALIPADLIRV